MFMKSDNSSGGNDDDLGASDLDGEEQSTAGGLGILTLRASRLRTKGLGLQLGES